MKTFLVGGSVRDKYLGIPANDTDYLVTDSSEEDLLDRGLIRVGQSFSIYLDRVSGDEYTLADTPEVDLARRDLTINAMALDEEGNLLDPHNGMKDLREKVLRHVDRKNFFTDPLRVIRTVRFLIQLPGFTLHPETEALIREVAATKEYAELSGERIIKELKRVLSFQFPSRFFETLKKLGALSPHFKELANVPDGSPPFEKETLKFAWLCTGLTLTDLKALSERLGIQNDWKETAEAWVRYRNLEEGIESLLDFFYAIDAFRKPFLLEGMDKVKQPFELAAAVGISSIDPSLAGKEISRAIRDERLRILTKNG